MSKEHGSQHLKEYAVQEMQKPSEVEKSIWENLLKRGDAVREHANCTKKTAAEIASRLVGAEVDKGSPEQKMDETFVDRMNAILDCIESDLASIVHSLNRIR